MTIAEDAEERELERGLVAHIRQFLIELGAGFAFLGQQYWLEVGGEDYYIDLLFYHVKHERPQQPQPGRALVSQGSLAQASPVV